MKDINKIKQQIVDIAKLEYHTGMVNMFEGNISVRLDDRFLITPSQVNKDIMTPEMILEIDFEGNILNENGLKPSSEFLMHLEIYRLRPEINAVVHNHSMYATAFAMNHMPIKTECLSEINQFLGEVPVIPYGTPGTDKIYKHFEEMISDKFALLLANHGVVTFAPNLDYAFSFAEAVEKVAQQIYISKQLGKPAPLPDDELKYFDGYNKIARQTVIKGTTPERNDSECIKKMMARLMQKESVKGTRTYFHEPYVIKGPDSLNELPEILKEKDVKNVLVMTTAGFIRRGALDPFFGLLKNEEINYTVFNDIVPDPTVECVENAYKAYLDNECEAIIAIGGGSVLDCAKIAGARVARPDLSVGEMKGALNINKAIPPLYAVPTTAGTGSETTLSAVITDVIDGKPYKYIISDFCILPEIAVLDPCLLADLPPYNTAITVMDALTHAIEAYTNNFASDEVKMHAKNAVKMILENLEIAYEDGKNLDARMNLLQASYEAGIAIATNYVGYVHAVAHGIGALYGVPHGEANAVILANVMEQFGESVADKLNELAQFAGLSDEKELIETIKTMNKKLNIPDKIKELKADDFDTIIDRALAEAFPIYPVPQFWDREDFRKLLDKLIG